MLASLTIRNFKSIKSAHARFGLFTRLEGDRGSGKSNLLDAICFLGDLANAPVGDACELAAGHTPGVFASGRHAPAYLQRALFYGGDTSQDISFAAKMILEPRDGQAAKGRSAALVYKIGLRYDETRGYVVVAHESLVQPPRNGIDELAGFAVSDAFCGSVVAGTRRAAANFISTDRGGQIRTHNHRGEPLTAAEAGQSPLTVAGHYHGRRQEIEDAGEEMRGWRRFDPSPARMAEQRPIVYEDNGLSHSASNAPSVLSQLADDLDGGWGKIAAGLRAAGHEHVGAVSVDRNIQRSTLSIWAEDAQSGLSAPITHTMSSSARLDLAWMLMRHDQRWGGTLCCDSEQPISHRAPTVEIMAACRPDAEARVGPTNRLRQVISVGIPSGSKHLCDRSVVAERGPDGGTVLNNLPAAGAAPAPGGS